MKTLLVTGGCGFIGSHFVRLVLSKRPSWRVVNLDKLTYAGHLEHLLDIEKGSSYRFVHGDINDRALTERLLQEEKPWALVNFAAESHVDWSILDSSPFLHANVLGLQTLLESCRLYKVERFVQISTDEVYGDAEGKNAFRESSRLNPSSPYAASKAASDLLCLAYRRTYNLPALIVRSSNNYGPFQFPEKLIPLMVHNALTGKDLPLYGDGVQRRDWLYVEDNCEAILRVLEQGKIGSIYNVATTEERSNLEVVRVLCLLLAEEARLDLQTLLGRIRMITDRPGHDRRYAIKTQRILHELGWSPTVSFEEGMQRTVRWYIEHQDWVKRVTSGEYHRYFKAVYLNAWGTEKHTLYTEGDPRTL